jgi:hypothetical protein
MKTRILIFLALSIVIAGTAGTLSHRKQLVNRTNAVKPVDPVFNFVHGHRQGKGATIAWSSNATSSTVVCFDVLRTYEDPNDPYAVWDVVGSQNCNNSRNYKNTETPVSAGMISYVVVASMVGGGTAFSDIVTIQKVQH